MTAGEARGRIMPWVEHVFKGLSMAGAVTLAIIGCYFTIIKQIDDHAKTLALHDQRFVADELTISRIDESQRTVATETRQKLERILEQIADLRVLVASQSRAPDSHR